MIDSKDFQSGIDLINSSDRILVTSHVRPDGDAAGSVRAICCAAKKLGKQADAFFLSGLPVWYEFLFEGEKIFILGDDVNAEQLKSRGYDLLVIVDTNSYVQLPGLEDFIRDREDMKVLVIDHHVSNDGLGDVEIIETEAAAVGEIVYELFGYAGWGIDRDISEAIFTAIATDSGWFRFGNTDARLFRTAADLLDCGIRPNEMYRRFYQNYTRERFMLMGRVMNSIELYYDGKVAIQYLSRKDFEETGANGSDTENLIDICQRMSKVDMAVMFVELGERVDGGKDERYRCSLRSKGRVDVRRIAQKFGGGGHTVAAGVNLEGDIETVKRLILDEAGKQLG